MEELKLRDEFIKLGQAMKAAGIVSSGIDAKTMVCRCPHLHKPRRGFLEYNINCK